MQIHKNIIPKSSAFPTDLSGILKPPETPLGSIY